MRKSTILRWVRQPLVLSVRLCVCEESKGMDKTVGTVSSNAWVQGTHFSLQHTCMRMKSKGPFGT